MFRTGFAVLRFSNRFQQKCGCQQTRNFPRFGRAVAAVGDATSSSTEEFQKVETTTHDADQRFLTKDDDVVKPEKFAYSKMSTAQPESSKIDTSPSIFDETSKKSTENTSGEFAYATSKPSGNAHQALRKSYRSMILALAMFNRNTFDDKPLLLVDGMFATNFGFNNLEFCDFFPLWWQMFQPRFQQYDVETLCKVVEHLGVINYKTNASLRRHLKMEEFLSILNHILVAQKEKFVNLNSKSVISLYNGLASFCLLQKSPIVTDVEANNVKCYPPVELLSNTLAWIDKLKNDDSQVYEIALTCCLITQRLATMEFRPTDNDRLSAEFLPSILPYAKAMFELNANLTEKLANSVDLSSIIASQIKFSEGYLWFLKDGFFEEFDDDLIGLLLESAKNFFRIRTSAQAPNKVFDDQIVEEDSTKNINLDPFSTRKMPSLMIELCTSVLELCFKTSKLTEFLNLKLLWGQVVENDIHKSSRRSVNRLIAVLRTVEANLDFRKIMETQTDMKDLVSADIWKITIGRLEETMAKLDSDSPGVSKPVSGFESKFRQVAGGGSRTGYSRVLKEISKNLGRNVDEADIITSRKTHSAIPAEDKEVPPVRSPSEQRRPSSAPKSFVPPDIDEFLETQHGISQKKRTVASDRDLQERLVDARYREKQTSSSRARDNESKSRTLFRENRHDEVDDDFATPPRRQSFGQQSDRSYGNGRRSAARGDDEYDDDDNVRPPRRQFSRYGNTGGFRDSAGYGGGGYRRRYGNDDAVPQLRKRETKFDRPDERWRFMENDEDAAPTMRQRSLRRDVFDDDDVDDFEENRRGVSSSSSGFRRMTSSTGDDDAGGVADFEQFPRGNRGRRQTIPRRSTRNAFKEDDDF